LQGGVVDQQACSLFQDRNKPVVLGVMIAKAIGFYKDEIKISQIGMFTTVISKIFIS